MTTDIREAGSHDLTALRHRIAVLISLILCLSVQAGLAWELHVSTANGFTDFQEFYGAAMVLRAGQGQRLYDPSVQTSMQQEFTHRTIEGLSSSHYYNHAPYEVFLYLPLTLLSFVHAAWCWWGVNLLLLYGSMYLLLPFVPWAAARMQWALLGVAIFIPLLLAQIEGQDTILTLFLFVVCFVNLTRDRFAIAGAALAITMYKPPLALPILLLVAITARKRLPVLGGFFCACVILFALSILAVGWTSTVNYPALLVSFAHSEFGHTQLGDLPNIRGIANTLFETHISRRAIFLIVAAVSALVVTLTAWLVRTADWHSEKRTLNFALIVLATLLVGYHEYAYDMAILLLPLLLLWDWTGNHTAQMHDRRLLFCALLGLFCVSEISWLHAQIFACALVSVFAMNCREAYRVVQIEVARTQNT